MGFRIDIDDSEARQAFEELTNAVSAETLLECANVIQRTARQQCGERVEFKGSIDAKGKFHLTSHSTTKNVDCLIEAIRKCFFSMHPVTKALFEKVIESLQAEKSKKTVSAPS
jgi:hypothetical protein